MLEIYFGHFDIKMSIFHSSFFAFEAPLGVPLIILSSILLLNGLIQQFTKSVDFFYVYGDVKI